MARVITFSRFFPANHPKKGEPTFFVEKIWAHLILTEKFDWESCESFLCGFWCEGMFSMKKVEDFVHENEAKTHTIREGNRWKKDDVFSPRVWGGKPYNSSQIVFAPELTIPKTEIIGTVNYNVDGKEKDIRFWVPSGQFSRNGVELKRTLFHSEAMEVAKNDGLLYSDFRAWFNKGDFEGQKIHF